MKSFKGTKGDWKIVNNIDAETDVRCNGLRIAEVKHYQGVIGLNDPSIKEGKANAKLISAAPLLLNSAIELKGFLKWIWDNVEVKDGSFETFSNTLMNLDVQNNEAIEKALGY